MESSAHTISSILTFFAKVIFPTAWIGLLAMFTLSIYLSPDNSSGGIEEAKCLLPLLIIGGTIGFWWTSMPLKRVRLDDKVLYISNYLTEIVFPLNNVVDVIENFWWNYRPVTIYFRASTRFGNQVTFIPKTRWLAFWSRHPVVEEIRLAVSQARGCR